MAKEFLNYLTLLWISGIFIEKKEVLHLVTLLGTQRSHRGDILEPV